MKAENIYEKLKNRFGDKVGDLISDNPDPYIFVQGNAIVEICTFLKGDPELSFDFLESISGVDTKELLHLVYHLFSYTHRHSIVIKIERAYDDLDIPTVSGVWNAANWHEREQFDLFGFNFPGHPDLRRILLPEDWIGHPLRKNYEYPEEYHGIDHHRDDPKEQFKALDDLVAKAKEKASQQASGDSDTAPAGDAS